jgi:hypothetical protein
VYNPLTLDNSNKQTLSAMDHARVHDAFGRSILVAEALAKHHGHAFPRIEEIRVQPNGAITFMADRAGCGLMATSIHHRLLHAGVGDIALVLWLACELAECVLPLTIQDGAELDAVNDEIREYIDATIEELQTLSLVPEKYAAWGMVFTAKAEPNQELAAEVVEYITNA